MNYDEYGFPIFDDDYVSELKVVKPEQKKVDTVNIKKEEPKKDKNALF